jgi:tetratricopeptide (TPR) repeat protein
MGLQCRDLRRFSDAEKHFKGALGEDPRDDTALHLLASSVHAQSGREAEALKIVEDAIAIDPNEAAHHALRAFILNSLDRPKEALVAAGTARGLDPYGEDAWIAEAQAFLQQQQWAKAERAAREALALDADSSVAANLLASALRMQKKTAENQAQIAGLLERDPEDAYTHYNAGWSALQNNDHAQAESHFREALRLEPEFAPARDGLLTSFRARSAFYRAYLRYSFAMARLTERARWAVVIGVYLVFRYVRTLARDISPGLAIGVTALYFLFVLWGFVADAVGNFILIFDRFARYALRPAEKVEAIVVGGSIVTGIVLLAAGFGFGWSWTLVLGGSLIASAIPFSMVFTNKSRAGSIIFGSIGLVILASAALAVGALALGNDPLFKTALTGLGIGGIGALLSTWLSNVRRLRR